ncbi:MAG TPA: MarR family transcriptional regulator [Ktedonobacterales bacterium]|nr:MarR family transcriptional regulator [Ktedonobacterales bacterium]
MQNANIEQASQGAQDAESLAAALMEVAPLVMREIRARMRQNRGAGLSVPQFRALGYVRRHPACSLTALAEHLGLSVPATSRLVEALVAAGLVLREASPSDRRFVRLILSDEGERIQAEARSAALKSLAARLESLDPAQRAGVAWALEPLRQIFASQGSGVEDNAAPSP